MLFVSWTHYPAQLTPPRAIEPFDIDLTYIVIVVLFQPDVEPTIWVSTREICLKKRLIIYHRAWQTAGRSRTSHSASRTPQSRSGTGSPSQQTPPPSQTSAGPRQDSGRPQQQTNNVWNTQRSSSAGGSNGQAKTDDEVYQPVNGFNAAEVKAFLARDVGVSSYKPADVANAAGARSSGGAWGSKRE